MLRSVFTLNPGPWRWSAGVDAGLAVALPLALFSLAGRQSLGLTAALGAFTALYCASLRRIDRLHALPVVAVGLVAASALGVACSPYTWLSIACLVFVAAVACVLALGYELGPPGPMMFVLVAGVSGHLGARTRLAEASIDAAAIPVLVAAGALLAYLVVVAPLAIPSVRHREGPASGFRALFPHIQFDTASTLIAVRVIVAVTIAGLASAPLGAHRAYWVVITAIAVLQVSHTRRITTLRAVHRVLGTALGLAIFGLMARFKLAGAWLIAFVVPLQIAIEVVVARNYGLALIFITPLALTISTAGETHGALGTVRGRIVDTLLGMAIAMAVFWIGEWILGRRRGQAAEK